jgi:hypothetical protein
MIVMGVVCFALFLRRKGWLVTSGLAVTFIGVALLPYIFLYQYPTLFHFQILDTGDTSWIRVGKALIAIVATFGMPGFIFLVTRMFWKARYPRDLVFESLLFLFFLTVIRLIILPDELEYFIFGAVAMVLLFVSFEWSARALGVAFLLVLSWDFVRITFFDRDETTSAVVFDFNITPGPILVDRILRISNEYIRLHFISEHREDLARAGCIPEEIQYTELLFEKFPSPAGPGRRCVLTSKKWLARMRDVVFPGRDADLESYLESYPSILILHPLNRDRGWRRFIDIDADFFVWDEEKIMDEIRQSGRIQVLASPRRGVAQEHR